MEEIERTSKSESRVPRFSSEFSSIQLHLVGIEPANLPIIEDAVKKLSSASCRISATVHAVDDIHPSGSLTRYLLNAQREPLTRLLSVLFLDEGAVSSGALTRFDQEMSNVQNLAYVLVADAVSPVTQRLIEAGIIVTWIRPGEIDSGTLSLILRHVEQYVQMRRALFQRTRFEQALTDIASTFINTDGRSVDERIEEALLQAGESSHVDRSFVFLFEESTHRINLAYEWCAPGIASAKDFYRAQGLSTSPWIHAHLEAGKILSCRHVEELPNEGAELRELCKVRGVQSFILVPLRNQQRLLGVLGFATLRRTVEWVHDHVALLGLVGDLFVSALTSQDTSRALADSETRFQTMVESLGEGVIYCDLETRIVHVNQRLAEMTGFQARELIGRRASETIVPTNELDALNEQVHRRIAGHIDRYEMELRRKDGSTFWAQITGAPIRTSTGAIVGSLASVTDITEQKIARQTLERSEHRLRAYFQSSYIGLAITGPNLEWLEINDTACKLYGYSREELQSRTWVDMTHPDDVERDLSEYRRMVAGEIEGYTLEKRYLRRDGQVWHARVSVSGVRKADGTIDYLVALLNDITASKLAEEQLRLQREHLRQVIDTIPDLIYAKDGRGYYTLANKAIAAWYGTTPEKMIGRHASEFEPNAAAVARLLNEDKQVIELGGPLKEFEVDVRSPVTGEIHSFQSRKVVLRSPESQALEVLGVSTDITQRKSHELERQELQRRLLQSQKMDAIGQLAAGIAHDLNNSLAAVVGHLQLIGMDKSLTDTLRRSVDVALTGCERASSLIERLLGFSRQGKYNLAPVSVPTLVRETTDFLSRVIGSDVQIVWEQERPELKVLGDSGQLQQALTNLILNARQAMPNGGTLTFRFGLRRISDPTRLNPQAQPGEFVTIAVADTGCGIPPENLEKIFEPFFTTKQDRQGTGLGLAMVYGIVQHHGGWIEVESQLGQGTTFTLFLPRNDDGSEARSDIPDEKGAASGSTPVEARAKVVMVVDDEPALVDMACQFLSHAGFRTVGFSDVLESLEWFRGHRAEVELVILDMKMPKMDGREYLQQLKALDPKVQAVILSGFMHDQGAQELIALGALRFFQKPLRYPELISWISERLRQPAQNPPSESPPSPETPPGITVH